MLALATTAIAAVMMVGALAMGEGGPMWRAAGLIVFGIGLYATNAVPGHVGALLFFLVGMVAEVAPAEVMFAGFESAALWLVFSGLIMGTAIMQTGLGRRLAVSLAHVLGGSYIRVLTGVVLAGVVMAFVMPSAMGRVMLIAPVAVALAEELGFEKGSRGYTGVVMAATLGGFFPAFAMLPANIPNLVLTGAADSLYGISFTYGAYLLAHFPVIGLAKAIAIVGLVAVLYPAQIKRDTKPSRQTTMSDEERRLSFFLILAVVLWTLDFWHHISPAWVGMAIAMAMLMPRYGVLPLSILERDVNYTAFFFVAGVISLGAVVSQSGLADRIGETLLAAFELTPGNDPLNYGIVSLWTALLGPITTQPNIPAVMTPIADTIAAATGLPLYTVLLTQVFGFSIVFLPYQAPVLVVAMQFGGIQIRQMAKCTLAVSAITIVALLPLNYLWWRLLGYVS